MLSLLEHCGTRLACLKVCEAAKMHITKIKDRMREIDDFHYYFCWQDLQREREREREREGGKLLIFIYDRNHRVVRDVGARARARIYV